jgi:cellulose synthase subunit
VRSGVRGVRSIFGVAVLCVAFASSPLATAADRATASTARTLAAEPIVPAQEVSLAGLGLASQTVHGPSASVAVAFPPPAADLASSGSYLRVFFGHSAGAAGRSTLHVFVNDVALLSIPLVASTADGSVFVVAVPSSALHVSSPNLVAFDFGLLSTGSSAADVLYGRIDTQTALHYDLAIPNSAIAAYPYSLLGGRYAGSLDDVQLLLTLGSTPDDAEVAAALRLVADTGRRLRPAHLKLNVATGDQRLQAGGSPALVVGRFDDLPASDTVLSAAGFTRAGGTWRVPGSDHPARGGEGVLASLVSPWDHASSLIVVSGADDAGVDAAASALLGARRLDLTGASAVVLHSDEQPASAAKNIGDLQALLPGTLAFAGAGEHRVVFGLPALGTDAASPANLQLRFEYSPGRSPGTAVVSSEVDGTRVSTVPLHVDSSGTGLTTFALTGVHAGVDGVVLAVQLPAEAGEDIRLDVAGSNLRISSPGSGASLDALPYPFIGGPTGRDTAVVLARLDTATLDAAAQAMLALGTRAAAAPGTLSVLVASRDRADGAPAQALVIGDPAGLSLRWRTGAFATTTYAPLAVQSDHNAAWIADTTMVDGGVMLWLGGDPSVLPVAGAALADQGLRGAFAVVTAAGVARTAPVTPSIGAIQDQPAVRAVRLLPLLVLAALLGLIALRLVRRRDAGDARATLVVLVLAVGALASVAVVGDTAREPVSLGVLLPAIALVIVVTSTFGLATGTLSALLCAGAFAIAESATATQPFTIDFNGGAALPSVSDLRAAAGSVWQAVVLGGAAILATVPAVAVVRRLIAFRSRRRAGKDAQVATFVLLSTEPATNHGRRSTGAGLKSVVASALSSMHESAVVIDSRHNETVGRDEVLVMLTGVAQDHAHALVHRMEGKARRRLRRPLRANVIVLEGKDSAWDPGGEGGLGALLEQYAADTRQTQT